MKADAERASLLDSEVVGVTIKVICASGRMDTKASLHTMTRFVYNSTQMSKKACRELAQFGSV
jgi:hypothetical protein